MIYQLDDNFTQANMKIFLPVMFRLLKFQSISLFNSHPLKICRNMKYDQGPISENVHKERFFPETRFHRLSMTGRKLRW